MYRAHYAKTNIGRLHIWRSRGGHGLFRVEYRVGMEISSMDNYIMSTEEELLMCVLNNKKQENDPLPFPQPPKKKENVNHIDESRYESPLI